MLRSVGERDLNATVPGVSSHLDQPYLNNAANALTYGLMSVGNKLTAKWTLFIGAAFYTPYAAGLYCNNRYGNEWFLLLGAGFCGIGASLLWASEAAIAVGYPEADKRGR
jgi:hypothetical protein